jgi:hypothetical protein
MNRELAKELKIAGFPIGAYRAGHKFYPPEQGNKGLSDAARQHGVTLTSYDLEDRMQDIRDGYYCPNLSDLIEACGAGFSRLFVEADIWTAQSDDPPHTIRSDSPEEAVARLWFALRRSKVAETRPGAQS